MSLNCVKLKHFAELPARKTPGSAGLDLSSAYNYVIPPGEAGRIATEIAVTVPKNCYGQISERSGFSYDNKVSILGGVIDSDYTGEIIIQLLNHGKTNLKISRGDRIAQLIIQKIKYPTPVEVGKLDETERGASGFGSTGKK